MGQKASSEDTSTTFLVGREEKIADQQVNREVVKKAQSECLQLATAMHAKLPPELRNVVYKHLCCSDGPVWVGRHHFKFDVTEKSLDDYIQHYEERGRKWEVKNYNGVEGE